MRYTGRVLRYFSTGGMTYDSRIATTRRRLLRRRPGGCRCRHTYRGRAAIKQWKAEVFARYQYTSELLDCERKGEAIVVTSRLTGNFPGSPVTLRFFFGLDGDKIASLKIIP